MRFHRFRYLQAIPGEEYIYDLLIYVLINMGIVYMGSIFWNIMLRGNDQRPRHKKHLTGSAYKKVL